jgi:hypothetical protein
MLKRVPLQNPYYLPPDQFLAARDVDNPIGHDQQRQRDQ